MLPIDMVAPDFELPDQENKLHKLSDYRGKWVVLYFYPKDDTPGCTKEACSFRDDYHQFIKQGIAIIGISKDTIKSHQRFAAKYQLNFPILSDPEKQVIKQYEAWGIKKFMGREFEGVKRITYLISPDGKIKHAYEKVNPLTHSRQILADISSSFH